MKRDDGTADTVLPEDTLAAPGSRDSSVGETVRDATADRLRPVARDSYQILGELARGGLGRIFHARDLRTGRPVAIKEVLRPGGDVIVRFAREALVTANLQHPSIIPVYEVGRWPGGEPFYAMKLVRGRSLEDVVAETRTLAERVALLPHVIDVADALAYAHGERIIHRDLKPANILVGAYGETVVIDWGLARNLATGEELGALPPARGTPAPARGSERDADDSATVAGTVLGTPAYMPPEQARGEPVDERADVYAIGAVLYHVLGGARPYAEAHTAESILELVEKQPPRPLTALAPDLPEELLAIVAKAMAPEAAQRYPSAKGLSEDLRRFQAGQLVGAHRYTVGELIRRWVRRHRAVVATAALAAVALALFGAYSFRRIARERDEAARQREIAVRRLGEGLEELGRQELVAGLPERALPFLAGALASRPGAAEPALAFLAGRARDAYRGLVMAVPSGRFTISAELDARGERLVTADGFGSLGVWDAADGALRWARLGVYRAALSPDDRWVAAGELTQNVRLYELAGGAPGRELVFGQRMSVLAWSPDGRRVAVGGVAGAVALLDLGVPGTGPPAPIHAGEVRALAFAPDGALLASVADDGALVVSDAATLAPARRVDAHRGGAADVKWIGERIVTAGADGDAVVWSAADLRELVRVHQDSALYAAVIDPAQNLLVTAPSGPVARAWDLDTGAPRAELPGHELGVNGALFVGGTLATSDENGNVRLWDAAHGELLRTLPLDGKVFAFAARGGRLATGGSGARVRVWDVAQPEILRLRGHTGRARRLTFDHAGAAVYVSSDDGTVRGWKVPGGEPGVVFGDRTPEAAVASDPPGPHGLRWVEPAPDDRTFATAREDGEIGLFSAEGKQLGAWTGHTARARRVVFSADGRTAFSASADGTLRRWDVGRGVETGRVDAGVPLDAVALAAADRVVIRGEKGELAIIDAATMARVDDGALPLTRLADRLTGPDGTILVGTPTGVAVVAAASGRVLRHLSSDMAFSADLSADGRLLAIGTATGDVVILDWASGARLGTWRVDKQLAAVVRLRPDGQLVATVGPETVVRVWDTATGRLLGAAPPFAGMPTQLAWTPDGRRLAIAGVSPDVWLWDLAPRPTSAAALGALARCVSPLRLDGSRLVLSIAEKPCGRRQLGTP